MRLDGSLEDFSLPDVLQLLAQTRKSGALQLTTGDGSRDGLIRLGEGAIDGASSDLRRQALARRLVGAGLLTDDVIAAAAADVRAGAPSLTRALLNRAELAPDDVRRITTDQATDAVCELLRWASGSFSFLVGNPDPDGLALGIRTEELVAEGQRRMQVWPALTSHIPSPDTVLRLAAAPPADPSCTREEWGLLALVDGNRSVSEIVALLGRSEFAVAGALAALVERGLLTVSEAGAGLADLQRRQAVIAGLEGLESKDVGAAPIPVPAPVEPIPAEPAAEEPPAPGPPAAAVTSEPASEPISEPIPEPAARAQEIPTQKLPEPVAPASATHQPMTEGSAALDLASRASSEGTVRGLDSAVTKSLVLRLIAGVRGL